MILSPSIAPTDRTRSDETSFVFLRASIATGTDAMDTESHPFSKAYELAMRCHDASELPEAAEAMRDALRSELSNESNPRAGVLDYYLSLARSLAKRLGCHETIPLARTALEVADELHSADRELLRTARYALASFLSRDARPSEAADALLPIVAEFATLEPPEMPMIWVALLRNLLEAGRLAELERHALILEEVSERGGDWWHRLYALEMLALARERQGAAVERIAEPLRAELALLESLGRNRGKARKSVEDWLERIGAGKP
jgi:hypothetical protein